MSDSPPIEQTVFDETGPNIDDAKPLTREHPILMILEGGDLKTRFRIDEPQFVLGRDVGAGLHLADPKLSRHHARLTYLNFGKVREEPRIQIEDLGSTNGTFVNGVRIDAPVLLEDRDKITVGSVMLGFFLHDATTLRADESLIRLASVDSLTGLNNRGIFNLEIQREFERARRYGRELTLVMFDIDNFKKFNDTYGHKVGDDVLRHVGKITLQNCRSNDIATRYGGEEFAVILPETPMERALIQAERLRKSILAYPMPTGETAISVTVSVGLAMLEPEMTDPLELIDSADRALYRAKESGRNQVCWNRIHAPPRPEGGI
jgi:two-component system, cell cycle response regulator